MPALPPLVTTLGLAFACCVAAPAANAYPARSSYPASARVRAAHQVGVDGLYAAGTEAAVRRFQQVMKLPATGVAGSRTQRALGLRPGLPMRRGSRGPGVAALQHALLRRGYKLLAPREVALAGAAVPSRPALREVASVSERQPAAWSPPIGLPVLPPDPPVRISEPVRLSQREVTPDVFEVSEPVDPLDLPEPARPTVVERPALLLEGAPDPAGRPTLEADAGLWLVPTAPGATTVDLARPAWAGSFAYWRGDWGLDAGFALLSDGRQAFDGRACWRDAQGRLALGFGWRGFVLGAEPTHLGAVGVKGQWPLLGDATWLEAEGHWGLGLPLAMFADGYGGLAGRLGPVRLRGGWRGLALTGSIAGASLGWQGPVFGLQVPL